jgi:Fungalysin metallopeptidase (M36)/Fungalysin/Thermolysin Propeptide Motif
MSREIDTRNSTQDLATPQRTAHLHAAAASVSAALPGTQRVVIRRMDPATGNPRTIALEAATPETGNYIQRALQHLRDIAPAMGFAATQAPEYVADPAVMETSTGARMVNLQQRYKGIPVFQGNASVRFDPDGKIEDTTGSIITVNTDVAIARKLSVQDAVLAAAGAVAAPSAGEPVHTDQFGQTIPEPTVDIAGFQPKIIAAFPNIPEQSAVLEQGPFGDEIKAALVWFPVNGDLKLGWNILLTFPNYSQQYDVIVDANTGVVLYAHQKVQYVAAVLNVYHVDGGSPRQMTNVPMDIGVYGLPLPTTGQNNWRWCHKCQGLYFGGNPGSHCPAGGAHDQTGSGDYLLSNNNPAYPGQDNWRWCKKCQGLYFAGHATQGKCPAGGAHDHTGSGDYRLINQRPLAPGQHFWSCCHKCEGLYFSANPGSVCPAGGAHDNTGSGDYALTFAGSGLPAAFPDTWVAVNKTIGNSTNAHLDAAGSPMQGTTVNNVMTFNPANATGDDQKVLNIFYYCCYMHDFSYLLGFREADGNFQTDDFGRGGAGNDSVNAQSFAGAVSGTANMHTEVDGSSPTMHMGLVTSTNRHTAFDSTVVFHEFTHGISNRLVGGPMNVHALDTPQSGGMGEGWSDYMACTINNVVVLGNWVLNNTKGIRGFPYDSAFPDDFGKLGTGRYAADISGQPNDPHNVGEIWCATLMEFNRRSDRHLALQLVMDGFKLTPASPSFLDARDAIAKALDHMLQAGRINSGQQQGAWQALWSTFAHFGMGPNAKSNGAQLNGIVTDFTAGQQNWRWCHKCQGLFFNGSATKGKCPAGGAHESTGSGNYMIVNNWASAPGQDQWRWCHKCEGMYFSGNPSQGSCPGGGAHDHTGSGNYKLANNALGSPGQYNWRWCKKCQSLYFAGNATQGVCSAGGQHDHTGSGDYNLLQFSQAGQPFS